MVFKRSSFCHFRWVCMISRGVPIIGLAKILWDFTPIGIGTEDRYTTYVYHIV